MKLNEYELEAERQYRFTERAHKEYGLATLTDEQKARIDKLIEPDMEALRKFEYD